MSTKCSISSMRAMTVKRTAAAGTIQTPSYVAARRVFRACKKADPSNEERRTAEKSM